MIQLILFANQVLSIYKLRLIQFQIPSRLSLNHSYLLIPLVNQNCFQRCSCQQSGANFNLTIIIAGAFNSKMPGVISIEGNLGAGKSTLLSYLDVSIIKEPVDEWTNTAGSNILQRYYSDPKRWAFTFQLNALHSRTQLWNRTLKEQPTQRHFSERSPMADRYIFGEIMRSQGNMDASEFNIYSHLCETLMLHCPLEAIIYLKCDPLICHERIQKRNRQGEEGIPLEYLQKVHDRHEEWISRQKNVRILTIDTGAYDVENPEELGQLLATITEFINCLN